MWCQVTFRGFGNLTHGLSGWSVLQLGIQIRSRMAFQPFVEMTRSEIERQMLAFLFLITQMEIDRSANAESVTRVLAMWSNECGLNGECHEFK